MNNFWTGFEKKASKHSLNDLEKFRKGIEVRWKGFSKKSIKRTRVGKEAK